MVGNAGPTSNRRKSATIEFVVTYRKINGAWHYNGRELVKVIKEVLE